MLNLKLVATTGVKQSFIQEGFDYQNHADQKRHSGCTDETTVQLLARYMLQPEKLVDIVPHTIQMIREISIPRSVVWRRRGMRDLERSNKPLVNQHRKVSQAAGTLNDYARRHSTLHIKIGISRLAFNREVAIYITPPRERGGKRKGLGAYSDT